MKSTTRHVCIFNSFVNEYINLMRYYELMDGLLVATLRAVYTQDMQKSVDAR